MQAHDLMLTRVVLAIIWIVTGMLSLGIFPQHESLNLLDQIGLSGASALVALYGAASLDILLGILTLSHPSRSLWRTQAALVLGYSAIITVSLPQYWLHPFGPILKNLPILLLLWLLYKHQRGAP